MINQFKYNFISKILNLCVKISHFLIEINLIRLLFSIFFSRDTRNFCLSSDLNSIVFGSNAIEILVVISVLINLLSFIISNSFIGCWLLSFNYNNFNLSFFTFHSLGLFLLIMWFTFTVRAINESSLRFSTSALIAASGTATSTSTSEPSFFVSWLSWGVF